MALLTVAVGAAGRLLAWPLLTSTVGPTAYLFVSRPRSEAARFRSAALGHAVAIGVSLLMLVVFGLVQQPPVSSTGMPTWGQVAASATAVGATLCILELLASHHAPAAATALLITTGLAKPGAPLIGLVLGLAMVVVLGPLSARLPIFREEAAVEEQLDERPARTGERPTRS